MLGTRQMRPPASQFPGCQESPQCPLHDQASNFLLLSASGFMNSRVAGLLLRTFLADALQNLNLPFFVHIAWFL